MKAKLACLVVTLSLMACTQVQWTGKKMMGPVKRRHASEESAVRAINEYFNAARDMIGISHAGNHEPCLGEYWQHDRVMGSDNVCALVLKRYDDAVFNLAGYGQAPSGQYPWLGEIFEYVQRTETLKSQDEKMAGIDRYVVEQFSDLLSRHDSMVITHMAKDYFVIRGTCCRDVTVFDDWYKARFQRKVSSPHNS